SPFAGPNQQPAASRSDNSRAPDARRTGRAPRTAVATIRPFVRVDRQPSRSEARTLTLRTAASGGISSQSFYWTRQCQLLLRLRAGFALPLGLGVHASTQALTM